MECLLLFFLDQLSKIGSFFPAHLILSHGALVCSSPVVEKHCFTGAPVLPLHLLPLLLLLLLSRSDSFRSDAASQFNCQKTFTDAGVDVFMNSRHHEYCVHVGGAPRINWSCDTPLVFAVGSRINFYRGQTSFEDIKGLLFLF